MVIARDRRSGVSGRIPRCFYPTPPSEPTRVARPSSRGGYAILEDGGHANVRRRPSRSRPWRRYANDWRSRRSSTWYATAAAAGVDTLDQVVAIYTGAQAQLYRRNGTPVTATSTVAFNIRRATDLYAQCRTLRQIGADSSTYAASLHNSTGEPGISLTPDEPLMSLSPNKNARDISGGARGLRSGFPCQIDKHTQKCG